MEIYNACNLKADTGKAPTRLQRRAPVSLQLDQIASTASTNPLSNEDASMTIPLLSPVVIPSPNPVAVVIEKGGDQNVRSSIAPPFPTAGGWQHPAAGGWHHPALAPFVDPSTLFTVFQTQCMIVNQCSTDI
ncbi:hypothetical protein ACFX13_006275 [Malus domestica]|uniref:Uncharacterized protein n=1 Tax=Malus domestica TaxID=3750 RepID=A0A498IT88_MALDO|nr:uncharacterized protein LOC126589880 [Malus sylvestris]RXH84661.1 hypothetical protein DVH24_032945 [Malus domestica]